MPTIPLESLKSLLNSSNVKITNININKYLMDLVCCLWNAIFKGYFFDAQWLFKQIFMLVQAERGNISNGIMMEIYLLECQFWIKRKMKDRLGQSRKQLMKCIEEMDEEQGMEMIGRYNSLVLFDQKIELIQPQESQILDVIKLSDQGKIANAIQSLKTLMETYPQQLQFIMKILLGKLYLLQPSIQALEILQKVALAQQMVFESYLAKLLIIAGYKSLEKLKINPERYRNQYLKYEQYVRKYSNEQINSNIYKLEGIFKDIARSDIPSDQLSSIGSALDIISNLPCYPSPSITQLELYLLTVSAKYNENKLAEAKKFIQRCRDTAKKLGLYSGSRASKIDYKLALVLQKQKKQDEALGLVQNCIRKQFKQKQLGILYEMIERLHQKKQSLNNSKILEEQEEVQSVNEEDNIVQKVGSHRKRPVVHSQNTQGNEEEEQQPRNKNQEKNQQLPQPDKNATNCCLIF